MARDLNKSRMRDSRLLIMVAFIVGLLTAPAFQPESGIGALMEVAGFILLAGCAIGRIYSTIYIGGIKNARLMTDGPYSVHRNPLYFYSLVGAAGIGMISGRITLFLLLAAGFYVIYHFLILREEAFLSEKFGSEFDNFRASTPRLVPDFGKFHAPAEINVQTRYLNKAVWDAIWWLAASPVFELFEYMHDRGVFKPLLTLY